MAKAKKGEGTAKAVKQKVLIVDHGSAYTKNLQAMYEDYPKVSYDITVKTDKEILKLKKSDRTGKEIKKYDILHPSGSRRKKNLNDESTNYILDNARPDAHVFTSCYGAQVMATRYGAEVKRLKKYQKGKKEINYKGQKAHIHKAHQWGIPITENSESKLEAIATSEQKLDSGKKSHIYEVFRAKNNPRHIGVQGHGEAGIGKSIMYDILDEIHSQPYSKKAA